MTKTQEGNAQNMTKTPEVKTQNMSKTQGVKTQNMIDYDTTRKDTKDTRFKYAEDKRVI